MDKRRNSRQRTFTSGRSPDHDSFSRRMSHKRRRAADRVFLRRAMRDEGFAFEETPPLTEKLSWYGHDSKQYGALKRWLASQVGRPWSRVYSDIRHRFGSRDKIWEAVKHELLGKICVKMSDVREVRFADFIVDEDGILRSKHDFVIPPLFFPKRPVVPYEFGRDRYVIRLEGMLYWLIPTKWRNEFCNGWACARPCDGKLGEPLSEEELELFSHLVSKRRKKTYSEGRRLWTRMHRELSEDEIERLKIKEVRATESIRRRAKKQDWFNRKKRENEAAEEAETADEEIEELAAAK